MPNKRRSLNSPPTAFETTGKSLVPQALQDFPDIWSGWQKDGAIRQDNNGSSKDCKSGSNLSPVQTWCRDSRFRKSLQNPVFVESLLRLKAEMERASQAPLRHIVIHYRADQSLYPSEEVMLHFSVHRALQEFLTLCSRQGRVRPEHPEYPLSPDGYTRAVIRDPLRKV